MATAQIIMTLTEALQELDKESTERFERHLPGSRLYAFLKGGQIEREETLEHLSYCGKCRGRLWDMDNLTREPDILDIAFSKAAASPQESTFTLLSEGKRFKVLFRRLLNQEGKGVVTLKVESPYREKMEGKRLLLTDAAGTQIIRSEVRNGETLGNIVDSQEIDWNTLIVREDRSVQHASGDPHDE